MRTETSKDDIYWIVTCGVQPTHLEDFKRVVGDLIAATDREPGTVAYEFSISEDQQTVHIFEHYRNSGAVVSHVTQTFAPLADRFLACAQVRGIVVYGSPSAEAREKIAAFYPTYMTPFAGFRKATSA